MATSSFDQEFVVKDKDKIKQIRRDLENAEPIAVSEEDTASDKQAALDSIKRWASNESS